MVFRECLFPPQSCNRSSQKLRVSPLLLKTRNRALNFHGRLTDAMAFSNASRIRISGTLIVFTVWFTLTIQARPAGAPTRSDREAIIELENEWLSHISDGPTLERILADDFMHPVPAGFFLTKQQHIRWAVAHP